MRFLTSPLKPFEHSSAGGRFAVTKPWLASPQDLGYRLTSAMRSALIIRPAIISTMTTTATTCVAAAGARMM